MGGGSWDNVSYSSNVAATKTRALRSRVSYASASFAYSNSQEAQVEKKVHPNLDPARIKNKPFKKLESRDSEEHPNSNAVLVCFDVTGSNYDRAVEAQQKLGSLMDMLGKYLEDPQVAIASNDDYAVEPERCVQISDFESDNRIDEHIKNVILVGNGGGNMGESYDLILYAAARKTILDCVEKRNKKGYLFFYADEPFMDVVDRKQVKVVYGDSLQADIPIEDIIVEAQKLYNVFVIWPNRSSYIEAKRQYEKLFGKDNVLTLQDPNLICELIGSVIGINEEKIADGDSLMKDLVSLGNTKEDAQRIIKSAAKIKRKFKFEEAAAGD